MPFAGVDLGPTRAAWTQAANARRALREATSALDAARAEEEFLRHAVEELDRLAPEPGEEAELDARRRLMQGAARIREDIARAHAALSLQGAEGQMGDALRWLEGAADRADGRLEAPLAALNRALIELGEAQQGVEDCLEALEFDPLELERVEERLFGLRALARKHGVLPDDLGSFADDLRARLAAIDDGAGRIGGLRAALTEAEARYEATAGALTAERLTAAGRLDTAMAAELPPLKLERAIFTTQVTHRSRARGARCRCLHRHHQPRHATRPARPDRVGWRAVALSSGAEGLPGREYPGPDDDLRRDRPRVSVAPPPTRSAVGCRHWRTVLRFLWSPTARRLQRAADTTGGWKSA
jgi:DNA repair ATPase RecN